MKTSQLLAGAGLVVLAQAQQTGWGQCGGNGWTGPTTCISGWTCTYSNPWYSQCLPGSSPTTTRTTTTARPTTTTRTTLSTSTRTTTTGAPQATGFKWVGVDESGAEFGQGNLPGKWGTDFIFPSNTSLQTLIGQGFNIFRVPFLMERMAPNGLAGALDPGYLANYTGTVNYITSNGGWAVIDPHNFGRYNGAIISDVNSFQTFWQNLATVYKNNAQAIFDTNNEYHDMDQTLVLNLNQAAINGIRAVGATSQYIFVEGNSYTGAWTWTQVNDNMKALTDPSNKIVYEMHQYLDSDGSGTSDVCVSSTIGAERVTSATQWLIQNNKVGIIGEFAAGANSQCLSAVTGMLNLMQQNSNVWLGALWWGGGPWWGTYIYGFEPPSSTGYNYYDTTLRSYAP
ncbi:glycoside hydrolase family 5 protein [Xylogone sp. PMI_703]|nr:glycoside hydrolase family 5 protein [Xylogone sp. PMI_703]